MEPTCTEIARLIDHSLLLPTLTDPELEAGCLLAAEYDVASVCVVPHFLARAVERLAGSNVLPTTTVGFPHGAQTVAMKVAEAREALRLGARELDAVVNVGKVRSHDWSYIEAEVRALCEVTHGGSARVKLIFENCYLADAEKIRLCEIAGALAVDWVKTSTGFGTGGATIEDLRLMRRHSPPAVQVKAAGGIRDLDALLAARAEGVTRVGASRTSAILDECRRRAAAAPTR